MVRIKERLEKGVGELIGFTAVSFFIVFFIIMLAGFIQLSNALNDISKAVTAASRAAAVSVTYDDAKEQSKRVAEATVTNSRVSDIRVDIEPVGSSTEWSPGEIMCVSVSGYVQTLDPFILSGQRTQKAIITVENSARSGILIPEGMGTTMRFMAWQSVTLSGSPELKLRQAGSFDDEGFGTIIGRYAIACTKTFGKVGDLIDFQLENGIIIHGVMCDTKNSDDPGCNEYGHENGNNVLEFCVDRNTWYGTGHDNPGTSSCHPEWNSRVVKVINLGINYFD